MPRLAALALAVALLAVLAAPRPARAVTPAPPEFYGVSTITPLANDDFNRLSRANIRTVRVPMYWPAIATGPGGYNWLNYDGSVINALDAGVTILPTFLGSPAFIDGNPFRPAIDSTADRARWQDFVRAAVERYGPGGEFWDFVRACPPDPGHCRPDLPYRPFRVWQLWNEPNHGGFWQPRPSPDEYAQLLELTSDVVHGLDAGAELITGGIFPGGRGAKNGLPQNDFIAALYQRDADEFFDGVGLHPYRRKPKQVRKQVADARAVMRAYGDEDTPLWITEIGWSHRGPKKSAQVTSRKGQAKRLRKLMRMLTARRDSLNIRLVSWFAYQDGAVYAKCKWCHGVGLLNARGKPKPSWSKYVKITGGQG